MCPIHRFSLFINFKAYYNYYCIVFYGAKMKYDESDNLVVRASRAVTDRVGDMFGKRQLPSL